MQGVLGLCTDNFMHCCSKGPAVCFTTVFLATMMVIVIIDFMPCHSIDVEFVEVPKVRSWQHVRMSSLPLYVHCLQQFSLYGHSMAGMQ